AIRLPDGRLVGWSAVCTHLSCAVLWREEDSLLECPCHDGVFDPATGEVVAGPPPRPLPRVELREDNDGIWGVGTGRWPPSTPAPPRPPAPRPPAPRSTRASRATPNPATSCTPGSRAI